MSCRRIIFLCHGAGNGGAERVITTLAGAFADKDYSVELITTNEAKNDYELNPKIHHTVILSEKTNAVLRTIDRILQLRRCIKKINPECIVSFSSVPNMQAILASLGLKCRVVISERTDPSRYPTSKIGRKLRLFLYPLADFIVFQTDEAKTFFPKNIQEKSKVIPNPIRDDLPNPYVGARERRIVGIGSLGEQKNWAVALNAGKIFFRKHPEYVMDIYGEGPLRDNLQKMIDDDMWLRNRVQLKGFAMNAVDEMARAKMYISSSDYEGISNAMLEALAVGTPSICTDCPVGGARMFIKNGETGFLFSVGDYTTMAEKMNILAENEEVCKQFSENSIKIKNELALDRIVKKWEEIVKEHV